MTNTHKFKELTHTGTVDFGLFTMDCGVTDDGESFILQQALFNVFGVNFVNYIHEERFEPHRPEGFLQVVATPLLCKHLGKLKYAYPADALSMFCLTVLYAKMHGKMTSPEDDQIVGACIAIADKLIPKALEIYEEWKKQIQAN